MNWKTPGGAWSAPGQGVIKRTPGGRFLNLLLLLLLHFAHETPSVAAVFRPLEEHMGGAHEWPAWLRDLVRMECLGRARVSLPVNLLGNVVPPIIVAEHAAPQLVDKRACDDVHDLMARGRRRAIGARRGRAALE